MTKEKLLQAALDKRKAVIKLTEEIKVRELFDIHRDELVEYLKDKYPEHFI